MKIERNISHKIKLDIYIKKGAHATEDESMRERFDKIRDSNLNFKHSISVNKQINDKERIAAALENPNLKNMVEDCIQDEN